MTILPVKNIIMNSVTYVLYSEAIDYCVLVDCGEWETLEPVLKAIGKSVKAVLLTHGHSDHIFGLNALLSYQPNVQIVSNEEGHAEIQDSRKNLSFFHNCPFTVDDYQPIIVVDNQILSFDGLADVEVLSTPGHDPSCLSYKIGKDLFTGDAYIPGVKRFTKFPRGDKELALKSIALLSGMEEEGFIIHCGHHSQ